VYDSPSPKHYRSVSWYWKDDQARRDGLEEGQNPIRSGPALTGDSRPASWYSEHGLDSPKSSVYTDAAELRNQTEFRRPLSSDDRPASRYSNSHSGRTWSSVSRDTGEERNPTGSRPSSFTNRPDGRQASPPLYTEGKPAGWPLFRNGQPTAPPLFTDRGPAGSPLYPNVRPAGPPLFPNVRPAGPPLFTNGRPAGSPLSPNVRPAGPPLFPNGRPAAPSLFSNGPPSLTNGRSVLVSPEGDSTSPEATPTSHGGVTPSPSSLERDHPKSPVNESNHGHASSEPLSPLSILGTPLGYVRQGSSTSAGDPDIPASTETSDADSVENVNQTEPKEIAAESGGPSELAVWRRL
jgi:hypothetical protein